MPWWLTLALYVGAFVVNELLRPKPKIDQAKPSSLGEFQVPTADSTRVIPAVFGTVLTRGPNVVWYGDLRAEPIIEKVRTSFFSSKDVTRGYRYYLGMQMVLCHGPIDVFRGIRFQDKVPAISTSTVGDALRIDLGAVGFTGFTLGPNRLLFGGDFGEGGVGGLVDFYAGSNTQAPNDYLQARVSPIISGYPTVSYVVFRGTYLGTSPYIKYPAFEISRYPNSLGLTGGKHIIATYDANPACILYEILTNAEWGLGKASGEIDLASFQAAGDLLHAEGFGMSLQFDTAGGARRAMREVLRHIDATVYKDAATGKRVLKLIRNDYTVGSLPVLDETNILPGGVELARPSWGQISNDVRIQYVSRADNFTQRIAQQQNLAVVQIRGGRVTETLDYLGVSRAEVANLLAARNLKTLSYPLARVRVRANREAYALRPGSPVLLNWPALGIDGMVLRVIAPDHGGLEEGLVELEAVEDIFAIASTAFSPPSPSGWVDPVSAPAAPTAQTLLEAPYHFVGAPDRHVLAIAVRSSGGDLGYEIHSDRAGGTTYLWSNDSTEFAPSGLLTASYAASTAAIHTAGFTINAGTDLAALLSITQDELEGGVNLCLIDEEVLAFKTVTDNGDGTWTLGTVWRGVLDTVPALHASGARVWFIRPSGAVPLDPLNPYPADGNVRAKLLPYNGRGIYDLASATGLLITTASRAQKPYPPGNVKLDGVAWPATVTGGLDVVVTWAHRHRLTQFANLRLVAQDAGNYVATPEGNYTIEIRVDTVLMRTVPSLTGTTWTWTAAMQTADGATVGSVIELRVIPKNGSLTGTYQTRTFTID